MRNVSVGRQGLFMAQSCGAEDRATKQEHRETVEKSPIGFGETPKQKERDMRLFAVLLLTILVSGCREAKQEPASTSHDNKTAHQEKPLFDWIAQAKGDDPTLRQKAIFTITELLKNENQQIRGQGEFALRSIGPAAVPALTELRYDKDWHVRDTAARLLGTMGPRAKTAIPALSELVKDKNERVQRQAALALASIGPASVPALTELLNDKDWHVRSEVAHALGKVGPEAKPAIPALAKLLKDNSGAAATCDQVRGAAAWGLGGIGPEAKMATPSLTDLLQDKNGAVRLAAAWALGKIGPEAKTAIPALTELLKDKNREVRDAAVWTLGKIGPEAKTAVPALTELLKDKDEKIRRGASQALDDINKETK